MGYYTYFEGEIDYSDVPNEKQQVIEKVYDVIKLMQWRASGSYGLNGLDIDYYDEKENEWIHFLWVNYDKEKKKMDLSGDRKDYHEATATFLSLIAPYLNPDKVFKVEYYGEDQCDYDEETDEFIPDVSELKIIENRLYDNGKEFLTNNRLSFPFPYIKNRK